MAENLGELIVQLKGLQTDPEPYMRVVVVGLVGEVRQRIHVKGQKANGDQIGEYSNSYLKLRSGNYANAEVFTRGINKGKRKNAGFYTERTIRLDKATGVFSGEEKVGKPRVNYNRGDDPKVILSLTRQMEQDFVAIAENDEYGLGFNNQHNFDKAMWNEERYKGVYQLSEAEIEFAEATITDYLNGLFG
jgi:hypothetical protein